MDILKKIIKNNSIKPDEIDYVLNIYDELIGGEESATFRSCKCPGSLRIIIDDLKIHIVKNNL